MTIPNAIRRKHLLNIPWNDGEFYDFCYEKCFRNFYAERDSESFQDNPDSIDCRNTIEIHRQRRYKEVYYGYFTDRAPGNLKPGVYYYLKRIHALPTTMLYNDVRISGYPQTRERNELLELSGSHLRKPLAVNFHSRKTAKMLDNTFDCQESQDCYVVEHPYRELNPKTVQQELTIFERLEYLDQLCDGLLELYNNRVAGRAICAYRDLKLSNGLIKPGPHGRRRFTVILTDFATIRFQDDAEPSFQFDFRTHGSDTTGTIPFLMSPDNTAPETLLNLKGIDSRIDVYALAQILAILFGYVYYPKATAALSEYKNFSPAHQFYIEQTDGATSLEVAQHRMTHAFEKAWELDERLDWSNSQRSWLELAIRKTDRSSNTVTQCFRWGNPEQTGEQPSEELLDRIRKLFFDSSRVDPEKRITVEAFQAEIQKLKDMVMQTRSTSRLLYDHPQSLYLFYLPNRREWQQREYMISAAAQAIDSDPSDFRLYWYGSSGLDSATPGSLCMSTKEMFKAWDMLDYNAPVHGSSISDALAQACRHYESAVTEYSFSGDIHVFTLQPINKSTLGPTADNVSLAEILDQLYTLSQPVTNRLRVWLHSPYQKATAPKSLAGREIHHKRLPMPEPSIPTPEPEPVPRAKEVPEPPPAPRQYYPTGPDGLFFQSGDKKVFVGRRKVKKVR